MTDIDNGPDPAAGSPAPTPGGRRRLTMRGARAIALAAAIAVVLIAGGWVVYERFSPPTEAELREQAGLIGKVELLIGVKDDIPGVSEDTGDGFTGFDIDIAYLVAADLGFSAHEVRFLRVEDEDRSRMHATDPKSGRDVQVDLVIATYSVTEEREAEAKVSFSAPYLNTEQSVMTREDHAPVHDMADLADETVCTLSTSTSERPADQAEVIVKRMGKLSDCVDGLRDGRFDAVTSDAPLIAGFVAREPAVFDHHDIGLATSELWGVNTGGNEPLRTLVNLALYNSRYDPDDRRWEEAYDRHLRPLEQANRPQPLAIAEQPDVPEPDVRRWPWE